ncbi:MAG: alpha/beta fold hydrolase [Pseudomonadota bacterium]|nr:alpha/beta fold hydrolase [Pseudomonadota bacterium]
MNNESKQGGATPATIVLVHGLWMSGFQLRVLKHRLEADGQFRVASFSYPSLSGGMSDHVRGLLEFARAQDVSELHFVGHSLGGLVILRALQLTDDLPPGRAVLLGTPSQGSKAAQGVARVLPFGRAILGAAVGAECIDCEAREWHGHRDIGVIAGSMGLGLGRLFADLNADHDGTVLVEETRLPGAKDHIVLSISHTGMLFSAEVADQARWFLRTGSFRR